MTIILEMSKMKPNKEPIGNRTAAIINKQSPCCIVTHKIPQKTNGCGKYKTIRDYEGQKQTTTMNYKILNQNRDMVNAAG